MMRANPYHNPYPFSIVPGESWLDFLDLFFRPIAPISLPNYPVPYYLYHNSITIFRNGVTENVCAAFAFALHAVTVTSPWCEVSSVRTT